MEKIMKLIDDTSTAITRFHKNITQASNDIEAELWRATLQNAMAYRAGLMRAMELMAE